MIKISKLADYGLVILNYLAAQRQRCYSAQVLAERTGIALPTVSKVLKLLNEAQVITSSRGANGGYRLEKDPEKLNLTEIITAVDGLPALTECCQVENECVHDQRCALRSNWRFINQVIIHALSQFTLADLQRPLTLSQFKGTPNA
jgi:FeS assembly SUF system regulator